MVAYGHPPFRIPIIYCITIAEVNNPDTNISLPFFGLVDTGADKVAIPADFAEPLGHVLTSGRHKTVGTGSGGTDAYEHTTEIQILDDEENLLYRIPNTPIDFMVGLKVVLLGGTNFWIILSLL